MDVACLAEREPGRYSHADQARGCSIQVEHLATWFAQSREVDDDEGPVPEHVEREFRRYLDWPSSIGAVSFAIINAVLSLEYISGSAMA